MGNEKIMKPVCLYKNTVGDYLKRNREMRGYAQFEVCDGICSVSTLSRIEAGEEAISFPMMEAIMGRMEIELSECEFFLAGEDSRIYEQREEIKLLFEREEYGKAKECLEAYGEEYGMKDIHKQFFYFWSAVLEKSKLQQDKKKKKELLLNAVEITVPDYREKLEKKELLSGMELDCIVELIACEEDIDEKEHRYEEFYTYFKCKQSKESFFPVSYRKFLKYYAECLYENRKYDLSIQICDEAIKELYRTSKEENRWYLFYLRAKVREGRGSNEEGEKMLCLNDLLIAYYVSSFYNGEEKMETLKKYIEEKYEWQFIN